MLWRAWLGSGDGNTGGIAEGTEVEKDGYGIG